MTRRVDLLVQFDDVNGEEDGSIFWITPRSRRGLALVRDRVDWYLNKHFAGSLGGSWRLRRDRARRAGHRGCGRSARGRDGGLVTQRADIRIQFDPCEIVPGASFWWLTPLTARGLWYIEPIDIMMSDPLQEVGGLGEPRGVGGREVGDLLEAAERNGIMVIEAPPGEGPR